MRNFSQNRGRRKILPQAYALYSEDKILSLTMRFGKITVYGRARDKDDDVLTYAALTAITNQAGKADFY